MEGPKPTFFPIIIILKKKALAITINEEHQNLSAGPAGPFLLYVLLQILQQTHLNTFWYVIARSSGDWLGGEGEGAEITETAASFFLVEEENRP